MDFQHENQSVISTRMIDFQQGNWSLFGKELVTVTIQQHHDVLLEKKGIFRLVDALITEATKGDINKVDAKLGIQAVLESVLQEHNVYEEYAKMYGSDSDLQEKKKGLIAQLICLAMMNVVGTDRLRKSNEHQSLKRHTKKRRPPNIQLLCLPMRNALTVGWLRTKTKILLLKYNYKSLPTACTLLVD